MLKLMTAFVEKGFAKTLIAAVLIGTLVNLYLCAKGKSLEAELQIKTTQVELVRVDNLQLANQLEHAKMQIEQYEQQINRLHEKVLAKMNAAETRQNDILSELEKNKNWASQPIPDGISRLLKQRSGAVQHSQTKPTQMSQLKPMPTGQPKAQHQ